MPRLKSSAPAAARPCATCHERPRLIWPSGPIAYCRECYRKQQKDKRDRKSARALAVVASAPLAQPTAAAAAAAYVQPTEADAETSEQTAQRVTERGARAHADTAAADEDVYGLVAQMMLLTHRARTTIAEGSINRFGVQIEYNDGTEIAFAARQTRSAASAEHAE